MQFLLAALLIYAMIGIWLVIASKSRGVIADVLFAALWPVYVYTDWKAGLL